jgi:hypothetical protein
MFSDEIVSCNKDPAELVLFHGVEMRGHIREGSIRWKFGHGLPGSKFVAFKKSGHLPFVEEQKHFVDVVTTLSKGNRANWYDRPDNDKDAVDNGVRINFNSRLRHGS